MEKYKTIGIGGQYERKTIYDHENILRLYQSGLTTREVAQQVGCGSTLVGKLILNNKISRPRIPRTHIMLAMANKCPPFTPEFIDYLDGLMISDGSLVKPPPNSGGTYYAQECVKRQWLESISIVFEENNISSTIRDSSRKGRTSHTINTLGYDQLLTQRNRWYNSNGKFVPKDINISNVTLLKNWIYGDGTLLSGRCLRFCTDSFAIEDIDFLIEEFNKLGLQFKKVYMGQSKQNIPKYRIALGKKSGLVRLYDYIGACDVECYNYKWMVS